MRGIMVEEPDPIKLRLMLDILVYDFSCPMRLLLEALFHRFRVDNPIMEFLSRNPME